jgi:CMP-N-acetylneuraminic acid synthetase
LPQKTHPNVFDGDGYAVDGSFILNASIYVVSRNWLMTMGTHVSETPVVFPMDRRHSLDIDEEDDLKIAELFLKDDQHIF